MIKHHLAHMSTSANERKTIRHPKTAEINDILLFPQFSTMAFTRKLILNPTENVGTKHRKEQPTTTITTTKTTNPIRGEPTCGHKYSSGNKLVASCTSMIKNTLICLLKQTVPSTHKICWPDKSSYNTHSKWWKNVRLCLPFMKLKFKLEEAG